MESHIWCLLSWWYQLRRHDPHKSGEALLTVKEDRWLPSDWGALDNSCSLGRDVKTCAP